MLTTDSRRVHCQQVADLAREVLGGLFEAHVGAPPRALRVYRQGDALMLLLRFDPDLAGGGADSELEARMDATLMAMFELVTEVVSARSGCDLEPGNLSVCAPTGLAVFALRVAGGEQRHGSCLRVENGRARREFHGGALRLPA